MTDANAQQLNASQRRAIIAGAQCEVHFDALTRQLHATDASVYQAEPMGVAFPRNAGEASAVAEAAAEAEVTLIPRGAGTGLAGGALGTGLIINMGRYAREITDFDEEQRRVRVGAGVVLDQLNAYLRPHGLQFGPDVATSSRATLGGMIANNSSGSHAPYYGVTADHVRSLELVLGDGRIVTASRDCDELPEVRAVIEEIAGQYGDAIRERCHDGLIKRWPGYGLDRWTRNPGHLGDLIAGSEGTLAAIASAELDLVPLPAQRGLAILFFDSVKEAMAAAVELASLKPAAIEHIDRVLFDQTRGQRAFKETRGLLGLDEQPCEAILIAEFFDDVEDRLAETVRRNLGQRTLTLTDPAAMNKVWAMRKAGLTLLTGCKGPAKPVAGIEDVAVRPEQLPDYVDALQGLMEKLGLEGSFYGHAASGLLHIRPVLDLHDADDVAKYRKLGEEAAAVTRQFKGSIAGEHGVGMARTEFLPDQLGPELMNAMGEVKRAFDPDGRMNPGKIIDDGTCRFDTNLRWGAGYEIPVPFEPKVRFAEKDESFVGNLEQCNGNGACLKLSPTMCPTFLATRQEVMSTRGRANTIRAVLDGRIQDSEDPLTSPALDEALKFCLACKACKTECPSNVDMALLKAELLHARKTKHGFSMTDRILSNADWIGRLGTIAPAFVNKMLRKKRAAKLNRKLLGFSKQRPLPRFATQRFDAWFKKRQPESSGARGGVILWDDTSTRYYEPEPGRAAVRVLEAAGYRVSLASGRKCCGRPAFSVGHLDKARKYGAHNVALLMARYPEAPVVFLEPSCYSMFVQDYRELGLENAETVAKRCFLFEDFVLQLLESEPSALTFAPGYSWAAIHNHCHAKTLMDTSVSHRLASLLPNSTVTTLDTACCGMAGAYGLMRDTYDMSVKTGKHMAEQINALKAGTSVVASGTSCRAQIDHMTDAAAIHMAELLANALASEQS